MIQVQKPSKKRQQKLDAQKATPDQTPAATTKLEIVKTQNYNEAQTQFNKAQDALDQLNADIQVKRQALANAKRQFRPGYNSRSKS